MEEKYLPIGSVVLLEGGTKKVMITGFLPMQTDSPDEKIYDYSGCLFPEGLLSSDQTAVFDHHQIKEICFVGFKNEESINFNQAIKDAFGEDISNQPTQVIEPIPSLEQPQHDVLDFNMPQQMPAQPGNTIAPTQMPAQPMQQITPTPQQNPLDLFPFGGGQSTTGNNNPMYM